MVTKCKNISFSKNKIFRGTEFSEIVIFNYCSAKRIVLTFQQLLRNGEENATQFFEFKFIRA